LPAYSSLNTDADGNLWVQEYRAEGEQHTRWTVFDPLGKVIATVNGPEGFTVYDIGRDYIAGVRTDDMDVERVEIYSLTRSK
jgi:hypothetical protein